MPAQPAAWYGSPVCPALIHCTSIYPCHKPRMVHSCSQLFHHLQGAWTLHRCLGTQGRMQGKAYFGPWGPGIFRYHEQGKATWGNQHATAAHRTYAYVYREGNIAVHFWNHAQECPGSLLHTLLCSSETAGLHGPCTVAASPHYCGLDCYQASYTFLSPQQFFLTYRVQGPRKDYVIQTRFDKI